MHWVDRADDIPASLWDACFPPPFEGRWWYRTLENCGLQDQFTFAYAILERDGSPVGIAPAFVMDVPLDVIAPEQLAGLVRRAGKYLRFLRYQRTLFVGSPCADEGTVGLLPGITLQSVAPELWHALRQRARQTRSAMIVWKDFPAHDALALGQLPGIFRVTSFPGTRVALPGRSFDDYFQSLKGSRRHNLKKKLRRGSQACPTFSQSLQQPPPAVLDEIFPLFWQTYEKGKTKFEKLNRRFFELIAAEPVAHFILIRRQSDARLLAFMLCFAIGSRAINKFIGIDYGIDRELNADAYLYFQLWQAAVRWAYDHGLHEFQSGQTGYRPKLDLGHELVPLDNFCQHRNRLVHRLFAWQARGISWQTLDSDLRDIPGSSDP